MLSLHVRFTISLLVILSLLLGGCIISTPRFGSGRSSRMVLETLEDIVQKVVEFRNTTRSHPVPTGGEGSVFTG